MKLDQQGFCSGAKSLAAFGPGDPRRYVSENHTK